MNSLKNTINAVSLMCILVLVSCKSPEKYAEEWCDLNSRIIQSSGEEREKLVKEAAALENEIYQRYSGDDHSIRIIEEMTDECD